MEKFYFVSFYYPGFTICKRRNAVANSHIDEWELVKKSPNSFFMKSEPILPLFGYTDSSVHENLCKEANIAEQYGIDCLVFNHYFDGYMSEVEEPIKSFSDSNINLKFAINIVGRMPHRKLPFGNHIDSMEPFVWMNDKTFKAYAQYLLENFLIKPNYFKINNKALMTFYHVSGFINTFGISNFFERIEMLRGLAKEKSLELHIVGLFGVAEEVILGNKFLNTLPFDAFSCYVTLPNFKSKFPIQNFEENSQYYTNIWKESVGKLDKIIYPCVGAGWNATYRGKSNYVPLKDGLQYPYFPIIINDTPINFHKYLHDVTKISILQQTAASQLIFLGPFNEWSESCYLLPDRKYGFGKLDAILNVKKEFQKFE